jgi:dipeptidase
MIYSPYYWRILNVILINQRAYNIASSTMALIYSMGLDSSHICRCVPTRTTLSNYRSSLSKSQERSSVYWVTRPNAVQLDSKYQHMRIQRCWNAETMPMQHQCIRDWASSSEGNKSFMSFCASWNDQDKVHTTICKCTAKEITYASSVQ